MNQNEIRDRIRKLTPEQKTDAVERFIPRKVRLKAIVKYCSKELAKERIAQYRKEGQNKDADLLQKYFDKRYKN